MIKSSPVDDDGLRKWLCQEIVRKVRSLPSCIMANEITRFVLLIQAYELADVQCDCLFGGGCGHCLYAMQMVFERAYTDLAAEAVLS